MREILKLKDFLKHFENEDPDTEIVQTTNIWGDLTKDIWFSEHFVNPDEFGKELISNFTSARADSNQIKVLRIGVGS